MFLLEKQHLELVSPLLSNEITHEGIITRNVGKDNMIRLESYRYSVPLGPHEALPENQVVFDIQGEQRNKLIIHK